MKLSFAGIALSLITLSAVAEEKEFAAELELGLIQTTGNTATSSYKGKFDVRQNLLQWNTHFILEGLYKQDELEDEYGDKVSQTTAEKYFASMKGDYKLEKEHTSLFIYGEYEKNRFSGFDSQYAVALGYSTRVFTTDQSYLAYSVGPGLSVEESLATESEPSETTENVVVYGSAEYVYTISEHSKFSQTVSANYATDSDENTKTKAVTAVTASINSSLALKASFTIDYNSLSPEGSEKTDTTTAVTVVYSF
ncbi:MAG: putative salt-induced outer membrane protein [Lentisphaeria bacterium]|jgi:putative salt-induced outer membrane protein